MLQCDYESCYFGDFLDFFFTFAYVEGDTIPWCSLLIPGWCNEPVKRF